MKSILISIKPQYVCDILNGKKTIEIRKSYPHTTLPIKVYIYCTKDKDLLYDDYPNVLNRFKHSKNYTLKNYLNGKVVACFTLDKVEKINSYLEPEQWYMSSDLSGRQLMEKSCLSFQKLDDYLLSGIGYAWHISNLEIFDTPKDLSEFGQYGYEWFIPVERPPQSWCYVEIEE